MHIAKFSQFCNFHFYKHARQINVKVWHTFQEFADTYSDTALLTFSYRRCVLKIFSRKTLNLPMIIHLTKVTSEGLPFAVLVSKNEGLMGVA